jgi:hypothetical protein
MGILMLDQQQVLSNSISIISPKDECWLAFLDSNPHTNIFHHPAWSLLLAECYGFRPFVCAVCDTNGEIMAGLPLMEIESWLTGRRWVSLPFSDHCSPLSNNYQVLCCLLEGLLIEARSQRIKAVELREEFPLHPSIHPSSLYVMHTLPLNDDFAIIDSRIHPMHRRNVRIAQKRGVYIEMGTGPEHLKAFYQLHVETRRQQGIPVQPWRFFKLLGKNLLNANLGSVFLARTEGKLIAALVLLKYGQTLTYKYGASCKHSLNLRPNDLLFWTVIKWGCENGFKIFDLGRTDIANTGLRAFKNRWGAEETLLYYSSLSEKSPRPSSGRMMSLMKMVIRNSPLWVCRSTGELLYRHFG